jgi:hypothetical protein
VIREIQSKRTLEMPLHTHYKGYYPEKEGRGEVVDVHCWQECKIM